MFEGGAEGPDVTTSVRFVGLGLSRNDAGICRCVRRDARTIEVSVTLCLGKTVGRAGGSVGWLGGPVGRK